MHDADTKTLLFALSCLNEKKKTILIYGCNMHSIYIYIFFFVDIKSGLKPLLIFRGLH